MPQRLKRLRLSCTKFPPLESAPFEPFLSFTHPSLLRNTKSLLSWCLEPRCEQSVFTIQSLFTATAHQFLRIQDPAANSNQVCDTRDPIVNCQFNPATIAPPRHAWHCCQIHIHLSLSLGHTNHFTLQLVHCRWHSSKPHPHLVRKHSLEPPSPRSPSCAHHRSPLSIFLLQRSSFSFAQQTALTANTTLQIFLDFSTKFQVH